MMIAIAAILAAVLGYLINQLPSLADLPGKRFLILRVTAEIVALSPIVERLADQSKTSPGWLKGAGLVIVTVLVLDAIQLGKAVWQGRKRQRLEQSETQERKDLLKVLSQEIGDRRRNHLLTDVIDVSVSPDITAVGNRETNLTPEASYQSAWMQLKLRFKGKAQSEQELTQAALVNKILQGTLQRLLILGEAGAGKTTLLLEVTDQLLRQALTAQSAVIPVLLELSAWKDEALSLPDWIALELYRKYRVPQTITTQWLQRRELFLLLDGLDELGLVGQKRAVAAINDFIHQQHYPQVVICCRQLEFALGQQTLSALDESVVLQPLTDAQIRQFLKSIQREQVWQTIHNSTELTQLLENPQDSGERIGLRSPLLLTILVEASRGEARIQTSQDFLEAYIEERFRVYEKRHGKLLYSRKQTRHYLAWLASQLKAESATEFSIEDLRPRWLETRGQQRLFQLIYGVSGGLIVGVSGGLIVGPSGGLSGGLSVGLGYGLIYWLCGGLFGLDDIEPYPALDFSRKGITRGITRGLGVGLIIGLIYGLLGGLSFGVIGGLIGGVIFGLIRGLQKNEIELRRSPNQATWDSLKSWIFIALLSSPAGFALFTLPSYFSGQLVDWQLSPVLALGGGLLFGFLCAGRYCIQHLILRQILWRSGNMPENYAEFLNFATDLRLLHQTAGRYRFVHDLLRTVIQGDRPLPLRPKPKR